jgi:hypothetical protein
MIERRMDRFSRISRAVTDERDQLVISGKVVQDDDGSFRIDWATNPEVRELSAATAGEVLEAVRDLRDNVWALGRLREQR